MTPKPADSTFSERAPCGLPSVPAHLLPRSGLANPGQRDQNDCGDNALFTVCDFVMNASVYAAA